MPCPGRVRPGPSPPRPATGSAGARASTSTVALASNRSAADSSALWPAPITTTRRPAKRRRSPCSEAWETSSLGRPANGAGTDGKAASPVATTTRSAWTTSPSSSRSRKLPTSRVRLTILRGSISGTARRWNHIPYSTNSSSGSDSSAPRSVRPVSRSKRSTVNERSGSEMLELRLRERSNIPAGMFSRQNSSGWPNDRVSIPALRRWAATASPCGPAPMIAVDLIAARC